MRRKPCIVSPHVSDEPFGAVPCTRLMRTGIDGDDALRLAPAPPLLTYLPLPQSGKMVQMLGRRVVAQAKNAKPIRGVCHAPTQSPNGTCLTPQMGAAFGTLPLARTAPTPLRPTPI
jgi:hypothetical protein